MNTGRKLLTLSNHVLKYDSEMLFTRFQLFLIVAQADGCLVGDMETASGLNQATISRQLHALSHKPLRGMRDGLGWVEKRDDPKDPRRHLWYVTEKGRKVLFELDTLLDMERNT